MCADHLEWQVFMFPRLCLSSFSTKPHHTAEVFPSTQSPQIVPFHTLALFTLLVSSFTHMCLVRYPCISSCPVAQAIISCNYSVHSVFPIYNVYGGV